MSYMHFHHLFDTVSIFLHDQSLQYHEGEVFFPFKPVLESGRGNHVNRHRNYSMLFYQNFSLLGLNDSRLSNLFQLRLDLFMQLLSQGNDICDPTSKGNMLMYFSIVKL